ncbi:hypothetical protein Tco_0632504 [Tanacetum coccineum]
MRSKRTTKILLKIDDSVHSINNSKTNNKKNVSKNNGCSAENKFVECDDNKEGGECNMPGNTAEKECLMEYGSCDSNVGGKNISVESEKGNVTGEFNANGMEQCHENKSTMYTGVGGSGMKGMDTDKKPFVAAISKSLIDNDRNLECIPTEIDENGIEVMSINELRYNLRRMWSRYGFIVDCNNGVFFMKFPHKEGAIMGEIVLPLEAWTLRGISAIANRIGKPLIMDVVTASKCKQGLGLVIFAMVLIEVNAKKELTENVEIVYKNNQGEV